MNKDQIKNDNIVLSIIIPIFNAEKYLKRTVQSIINSGVNEIPYELILIDDGSTDKSLKISQELFETYPIIRIYSQQNKGISKARNLGLSYSRGTFVWFVDSDDLIRPGSISLFIRKFFDSDYDVLGFSADSICEEDLETKSKITFDGNITYEGSGLSYLNNNTPTFIWIYWYKRLFIIKNSLSFIGIGNEDVFFNTRFFLCDPICRMTSLKVYCYINYIANSHQFTKERNPFILKRRLNSYLEYFAFLSSIHNQSIENKTICRLYDGQLVPFISRALQSKLSVREWKVIRNELKSPEINTPAYPPFFALAIRVFLATPSLYPVYSFVYRRFFIPYILDNNRRR